MIMKGIEKAGGKTGVSGRTGVSRESSKGSPAPIIEGQVPSQRYASNASRCYEKHLNLTFETLLLPFILSIPYNMLGYLLTN